MKDSHLGLHAMPIWKAYAESSNAAMAKLAYTYYKDNPQKYVDHLLAMHLNKLTGIDLAGERKPRVKSPSDPTWSATSLPWMATGYEVLISPLHTCMVYNAVANGGNMMKPYLVSSIKDYGKEVKTFKPEVVAKVGDSGVIAQMQKCTAQVADGEIKYTDGVYQGSFVGFFPAEAPKYTICVVIRTKAHSAAYYGGAIAAPVLRMVADKIFSANMGAWAGPLDSLAKNGGGRLMSKMATARNYHTLLNAINRPAATPGDYLNAMMQLTTDSTKHVSIQTAKLYRGMMPDVKGMGLKDAVYMLETSGLQVQVVGKGKVQSQSIQPGTAIVKGQNIILQLS